MEKEYTKRYNNFCKALDNLLRSRNSDPNGDCVLEGTIQKFNLVFDISWKVMKDILIKEMGIIDYATGSPRDTLKTAYSCRIIKDDIWLSMLKTRNDSVHDYDGELAKSSFELIIGAYCDELLLFKDTVSQYYDTNHLNNSNVFSEDH